MLALTKKAGYALIAMTHLAELAEGELACAREIAERFQAPGPLLMNVMKELAAAGYVESVRGAHGGYRLARRPEEVTLAELMSTFQGPLRLAECVTSQRLGDEECTCDLMARCPIIDPIHRVHRRLRDFLNQVTLAEIVAPGSILAGAPAAAFRPARGNGPRTETSDDAR